MVSRAQWRCCGRRMLPERRQIPRFTRDREELLHSAGPGMFGDPWASEHMAVFGGTEPKWEVKNMGRLVVLTEGRGEVGAGSSCDEWGVTARRYSACPDKRRW